MFKIAPVQRVLSDFTLYIVIEEHTLDYSDVRSITETLKAKNIHKVNKNTDQLEFRSDPMYCGEARQLWDFVYAYLAKIRRNGVDFELYINILHHCMDCELKNCDSCNRYLS